MRAIINITIQLLWVCLCIALGYFTVATWWDDLSQPWYSVVCGFTTVCWYVFFSIVSHTLRVIKTNKKKEISEYRFKLLFDSLLLDEMMSDNQVNALLEAVLMSSPQQWKEYCLSRKSEYKPFYRIGKEVFAYIQEEKKYVRGVITNIDFGIEWWYYTVEFNEPISINNRWPSKTAHLLAKHIMDIETGKAECSYCHYVE